MVAFWGGQGASEGGFEVLDCVRAGHVAPSVGRTVRLLTP
jgi:hypothetical protein